MCLWEVWRANGPPKEPSRSRANGDLGEASPPQTPPLARQMIFYGNYILLKIIPTRMRQGAAQTCGILSCLELHPAPRRIVDCSVRRSASPSCDLETCTSHA